MELATFKSVIQAIPVPYLGFRSKWKTWKKHANGDKGAARALREIFDGVDEVMLSRDDLRGLASKRNLSTFVMATIVWGYPRGMRNDYVGDIAKGLDTVLDALKTACNNGIENWMEHHKAWRSVHGLGLSTYSKLLHFLSVQVNGREALILDSRIIDVIKLGLFEELRPLQKQIRNAVTCYPTYLARMHELAAKLKVDAGALEFFLYDFGLTLKPPKSNAAIALAVPTNGAR